METDEATVDWNLDTFGMQYITKLYRGEIKIRP